MFTPTELPLITFVSRTIPDRWRDIERLTVPDRFPDRVRSGIDVWVVSTFLELRARAHRLPFRVAISNTFPAEGAVLAHSDDLRWQQRFWHSFVAGVRADRPHVCTTPWEVVQNPLQERDRSIFIPSWPQPGLVRRDGIRRGISVLGHFGRTSSLPHFFSDASFLPELQHRGISFHVSTGWQDYSATDVCVGIRSSPRIAVETKRSRAFTREAVAVRWIDFLAEKFLPDWKVWEKPRAFTVAGLLLLQWLEKSRYRRTEAQQVAQLRLSAGVRSTS